MTSAVPVFKASKRTRADADGSDPPSPRSPPPSILPPPQIKCECSPSPPFAAEKRLVTSGTKRFSPIPDNCLPSCTKYKQNRLEWVASCAKELEALNLTPERKLFRDDGLIIDWRSLVPVWSDTLKPDPQDLAATIMLAHRSNAQWHRSPTRKESPPKSASIISTEERSMSSPPTSDAEPPLKKRLPVPPRPSSKRRTNISQSTPVDTPPSGPGSSSCPERLQLSDETERETHFSSRDHMSNLSDCAPLPQHGQIGASPKSPSTTHSQSIGSSASSATEEEMSEMTLKYLRRYVQIYESDRASLASAYAGNASFTYRVHHIDQNISGRSLQCFSSGSKRTRLDIVTTLLTLPSLHSNAQSSGIAQIEYDIFYLGAKLGMFVVCRVVDSAKTVVHNFILQRKEVDMDDAATEGVWSLTAIAHQILVFQS